jgi:hypothetical protein
MSVTTIRETDLRCTHINKEYFGFNIHQVGPHTPNLVLLNIGHLTVSGSFEIARCKSCGVILNSFEQPDSLIAERLIQWRDSR